MTLQVETILRLVSEHGALAMVAVVALVMLMRSDVTIRYRPRRSWWPTRLGGGDLE